MPLKLKETNISNEHNRLKNPNWREADQLANPLTNPLTDPLTEPPITYPTRRLRGIFLQNKITQKPFEPSRSVSAMCVA